MAPRIDLPAGRIEMVDACIRVALRNKDIAVGAEHDTAGMIERLGCLQDGRAPVGRATGRVVVVTDGTPGHADDLHLLVARVENSDCVDLLIDHECPTVWPDG
jgi:hypothetical protein